MLNVTIMTGRLVEAPELRHTNNGGTPVTTCRLAVRRDYVKKGDEDVTDFFDVVAWRTTAEFICKYMKKGSMIQVVGHLENRAWKDKHGQNRVTTELIAEKAYFGESKGKDGNDHDIDPFDGDANANKATGDAETHEPPPGFDPFG